MNKFVISVASLSLLAGCAGPAVKDSQSIQQSALEQAKSVAADQNPTEIIASTRDLQIEAQREDLYFFSPSYMEQAESAMNQAESALKENKPSQEVIAHALTAQQYFTRGLETKQTAQQQLKAGFDGLQMLRDLESDTLLKSDFEDLLDEMKDLIVLLEQGKTTDALAEQKAFLADVTELEVATLKKRHFDPAEVAFEKAEDSDAEDFAAKSFEQAQKALDALERFIESQPNQREQIQSDSQSSIRLSQHAEHVSKAVQPLLKLKADSAEAHVLFVEGLLQRIGGSLQSDDVTHLPLNSQSIALAQAAETIYKQAQAVGQKDQWEQEKSQLQSTINDLQKQLEQAAQSKDQGPSETTNVADNTESQAPVENPAQESINNDVASELLEKDTEVKDPAEAQPASEPDNEVTSSNSETNKTDNPEDTTSEADENSQEVVEVAEAEVSDATEPDAPQTNEPLSSPESNADSVTEQTTP